MAWDNSHIFVTLDVLTAAQMNQISANLAETAPAKITTSGDLVYGTGANGLTRRAIGSAGQVLLVSGGVPTWALDPTADLITTAGDLLYGSAADTLARRGIGPAGSVLYAFNDGLPYWTAAGAAYRVLRQNSGANQPEWTVAPTVIHNASLAVDTATPLTFSGLPFFDFYRVEIYIPGTSVGSQSLLMRFNNDSGSNYGTQHVTGLSTTVSGGGTSGGTSIGLIECDSLLCTLLISNRAAARKVVTGTATEAQSGADMPLITHVGGVWNNTSDAINRIDLIVGSGNFLAGTRVDIFGFNAS